MLKSALFAGDSAAAGHRRRRRRRADFAARECERARPVLKVQQALLIRDPACLPVSGADGAFGGESAAAVHRFKVEELGVDESQVIDDVGPLTVQRLDEIARAAEVTSVAVFNQFGDVLADVDVEVDDDGTPRRATTDALGIAKLALISGGTLTLEPVLIGIGAGRPPGSSRDRKRSERSRRWRRHRSADSYRDGHRAAQPREHCGRRARRHPGRN